MTARPSKLVLSVVWLDPDLQEISIAASSACFSGQVNLYAGFREVEDLAKGIEGFPVSSSDRREFTLGQNNLPGYGTASFLFQCADGTGHAVVRVELQVVPESPTEAAESAVVLVAAVASDIDRFVQALRQMSGAEGASAVLQNAA